MPMHSHFPLMRGLAAGGARSRTVHRFPPVTTARRMCWVHARRASLPSWMLRARRGKRKCIVFGRAAADKLPLTDGRVDLVFMSQIYHHLPDPAAMWRECRRLLRVGGYVCIRTGTRENDVVVSNFFPAVRAMLDADLPSGAEIRSNFQAAGFTLRHHEVVTEAVARTGLASFESPRCARIPSWRVCLTWSRPGNGRASRSWLQY